MDCGTDSNNTTRRSLEDRYNTILELLPQKLIDFDFLGQNVKAFIEAKCYSTIPGNNDACQINMYAEIMAARIPIIPSVTVNCNITKLGKKYHFYRSNILEKID
jgi:hypothetical protein